MARRFTATSSTTVRDLTATIRKMGATSLSVNQDLFTGRSEITFDRSGRRYVFLCEKYADPLDNLRASQLTISLLYRAMEEYGVLQTESEIEHQFARFFLPFEALPDDTALLLTDGKREWWQILGLTSSSATKRDIVNAYRALAKIHHPDHGGNAADFKRVRAAYESGINQAKD